MWHCWPETARETLRGIERKHGSSSRRAAAITTAEVRKRWACGRELAGARDRVLFLLGFAGALRRSELVGLDGEHLTWTGDGLKMLIVRSKTDAEGEGAESAIPRGRADSTCPVTALEAWLELSEISAGPLFGALRGSAFWPANAVHPCNTWNPLLLGA